MADPELRLERAKQLTIVDGSLFLENICIIIKNRDGYVSKFPHLASLTKIAELLDKGQTAEAIFLTNFSLTGFGDLRKANFDEAEARDFTGEWAKTEDLDAPPYIEDVQYRGYFHDIVVDDLVKGLNRHGGVAIAQVQVFGVNGIMAIPDGASLPLGWNQPYFIEVKTGFDADFTPNQKQVYALICQGGHAVSSILGSSSLA